MVKNELSAFQLAHLQPGGPTGHKYTVGSPHHTAGRGNYFAAVLPEDKSGCMLETSRHFSPEGEADLHALEVCRPTLRLLGEVFQGTLGVEESRNPKVFKKGRVHGPRPTIFAPAAGAAGGLGEDDGAVKMGGLAVTYNAR